MLSRGPALAHTVGMKTIDLDTLVTVAGGAETVAGARKLDTQTEAALTKLASDVKDLAQPAQNQANQLMTMMLMSRLMSR
jgi:hypothetical protein